jgi:hypothetical protein
MIGLSITTRNRPEVFKYTLNKIKAHWSNEFDLVVINDSDIEYQEEYNQIVSSSKVTLTHFWNKERLGIPHSKAVAFDYLKNCDYQIWFDDDCCPIAQGWDEFLISASVADDVHHYLYLQEWARAKFKEQYKDHTMIYSHGTACLMFFSSKAYEAMEGFHENYGLYGWWHGDLSVKMHLSGLTPAPYCTVKDIEKYITAFDLNGPPEELGGKFHSSMSRDERTQSLKDNLPVHQSKKEGLRNV